MKKFKNAMLVGILILGLFKLDNVLIKTMDLVDTFGNATGIKTIEIIDGLNEIYYQLGYK